MIFAPHTIGRCPLDRFCWERGLELSDKAAAWECSTEHARRICLPFGHPDRKVPQPDIVARIYQWSRGEIGAADHYPPPAPLPVRSDVVSSEMAGAPS